ncbi:hypothetical protein K1719_011258 [Acacia pycnantha]|nr:hypothetical protein K1719_011258 [Acacia pycnantha]
MHLYRMSMLRTILNGRNSGRMAFLIGNSDIPLFRDGGVGNAEAHQLSDGDGDNNGSPVETTHHTYYTRQEYQEDEHLLNDELFASDPVETPNPVLHRQDRTPNVKRRRRSGNADVSMACQAIHDLVKIRQNQCDNNFANSATAKVNEDPYSIEVAMDVLNDMVGLEDEDILMAGAPHFDDESIDEDLAMSNFFIIISNNSIHTKEPIRDSRLTGAEWVLELRFGHSDRIYEAFRMERFVFNKLCTLMIQKGWLADSRYVSVDEQLGIFLYLIGHGSSNRNVCERFQRSGQTISKYFRKVLTTMLQLAHEIIKPPPLDMVPMEIRDNPKHFPYFKDCIGAIDGTHGSSDSRQKSSTLCKSQHHSSNPYICSYR